MALPVEINPLQLKTSGGYTVSKSLRFRSSASAYLNRTPASASNRIKWTLSFWSKLGLLDTANHAFASARVDDNNRTTILLNNNQILLQNMAASAGGTTATTTAVFRDPSAWYHVNVIYDSANATAANRFLVYVNGVLQATTGTYPALNDNSGFNSTGAHAIGRIEYSSPQGYFDGYMAEINFIDGQALTPSSFGTYDANGVWQPIKYSGTYGTNGFYLNFGNTTSTTTLGYDTSGNSNNWTTNNISLTAGSTYDSMTDSPTVSSATVANYATLNPLDFQNANTYSNGNLSVSLTNVSQSLAFSGFGLSSGKWYWEVKTTAGTDAMLGVALQSGTMSSRQFTGANSVYYYGGSGTKYVAGTGSAYGATYGTADTIGIALDLSANTITYYKNNASQGAISLPSQLLGVNIVPAFSSGTGTAVQSMNVNFGQQPFTYTPPTGFNALNTYNLPTPTIANGAQYMAATLYTGTNANLSVNNGTNTAIGTTFQPDFLWIKQRSAAASNLLFDSIRGVTHPLWSDLTAAEGTATAGTGLTSLNTNGWTLGTDISTTGSTNINGNTYVGWQWKANGTGVSNTSGSITSTVSANTTAGFSILTFNSGTAGNKTVGHGLGVTPAMIITKDRTSSNSWTTWHQSLSSATQSYLWLNSTNASANDSRQWANTAPTSSVFSFESGYTFTASDNCVAYCWAAVPGYSAFGSYTGNGSTDGPFVYTGFRPRFVLIKNASAVANWFILDTSRDTYNVSQNRLFPSVANAEATSPVELDILSNGFKIRIDGASDPGTNTSGNTYIYAAFAENPFNSSRAR